MPPAHNIGGAAKPASIIPPGVENIKDKQALETAKKLTQALLQTQILKSLAESFQKKLTPTAAAAAGSPASLPVSGSNQHPDTRVGGPAPHIASGSTPSSSRMVPPHIGGGAAPTYGTPQRDSPIAPHMSSYTPPPPAQSQAQPYQRSGAERHTPALMTQERHLPPFTSGQASGAGGDILLPSSSNAKPRAVPAISAGQYGTQPEAPRDERPAEIIPGLSSLSSIAANYGGDERGRRESSPTRSSGSSVR